MKTMKPLVIATMALATAAWAVEPPAPPTEAERAALFASADADQSGGLSREELDDLFELVREERGDKLFASADADANGELTQAELEAARPAGRGRRGRSLPPGM